jgi:DNA (cytosine-5)-methyltransferase 1
VTALRVGALCSGIRGIELGLEMVLGPPDLAWVSEIDAPLAQYMDRHGAAPNLGDLTAVDWSKTEPVDILTAGFPCPPVSSAGKRKGTEDDRWIWPHIAAAVRALRPRWVFIENVAGLRSLGMGDVQDGLAEAGYDTRWTSLRASDVGAPHRRDRIFIAAHPRDGADLWQWARPQSGQGGKAPAHPEGLGEREPADQALAIAVGGQAWQESGGGGGRTAWGAAAHTDGGGLAELADLDGESFPAADGARGRHADGRDRPAPHAEGDQGRVEHGDRRPPADATRDGRDEGRPEPAGQQGRPDAALGGGAAPRHLEDGSCCGKLWGTYGPAIRRWAGILRPPPCPVDARGRLSPDFGLWMQGYPEGWLDGMKRTAALKAVGNSVCPQQAAAAFADLLFSADFDAALTQDHAA